MEDAESKLQECKLENAVLAQIIEDLQKKVQCAERRAREGEAFRRANAPSAKCSEQLKEYELKLEKLKRKSVNDRKWWYVQYRGVVCMTA
jgi:hypothetical protein